LLLSLRLLFLGLPPWLGGRGSAGARGDFRYVGSGDILEAARTAVCALRANHEQITIFILLRDNSADIATRPILKAWDPYNHAVAYVQVFGVRSGTGVVV